MKFKIGEFWSGNQEAEIVCESGFPLRDGGSVSITCWSIMDDEETIAFVPSKHMAEKIIALLNAAEIKA